MEAAGSFHSNNKNIAVRKVQQFQAYSAVGQPGTIHSIDDVEWDEKSGQFIIYEDRIREVFRGEVHGDFLVKNGEIVALYMRDRVHRSIR